MTLPYVTSDTLRIAGVLKSQPEDFVVEEVPLYPCSGSGPHLYVTLRRAGWNTEALLQHVAQIVQVSPRDIGYAGKKDRHAVATQTFSLLLEKRDESEVIRLLEEQSDFSLIKAMRHDNKLKRGHLLGNRFRLLLRGARAEDLSHAQDIASELMRQGVLNYYGEQRFGRYDDNAQLGKQILLGQGPRLRPWKRDLLIAAYQSDLFNQWLALRVSRGDGNKIISGDVAKTIPGGGLFIVDDLESAVQRFNNKEITYTGPMFGYKMMEAQNDAAMMEGDVLRDADIPSEAFKKYRVAGTRRVGLLYIDTINVELSNEGLWFEFELPKGAYATAVLREFTKEF